MSPDFCDFCGQSAWNATRTFGSALGMGMSYGLGTIGRGAYNLGQSAWNEAKVWGSALGMGFEYGVNYNIQSLTEVGKVMVEEHPYVLNMQGMLGATGNIAGAGSMVGLIPKNIGYSNSHFLQGGRIAYRWANQYGAGAKLVSVSQVGYLSAGLNIFSAVYTGYTVGAVIHSYYEGYKRYGEKHQWN